MVKMITEKVYEFEVAEGKKRERIDTYLANTMENATRSRIQHLIKSEYCKLNGKIVKANQKISPGDKIKLTIPVSPRPEKVVAEDIPVHIVYEDDYLMVVNKPTGMCVHPSYGHYTGTLVNALLFYTDKLSYKRGDGRPGIVHRIDQDTSGLLVVARDEWTHSELAKQFAAHTTEREYWAICWGRLKEPKGEIIGNIARSKKDRKIFCVNQTEGKHAHTYYEVMEEFEFASLIKLRLKTGRTHQIRVHMSYIGHPIFGDHIYNGRRLNYFSSNVPKQRARVENLLKIINRQALHAKTLGFFHPHIKKKMSFNSPLPDDFSQVLEKLRGN